MYDHLDCAPLLTCGATLLPEQRAYMMAAVDWQQTDSGTAARMQTGLVAQTDRCDLVTYIPVIAKCTGTVARVCTGFRSSQAAMFWRKPHSLCWLGRPSQFHLAAFLAGTMTSKEHRT